MKKINMTKAALVIMIFISALFATGCGGRSGGGVASQPPASPTDRGTLRITGVPAKSIIAIDGQQQTIASGTVIVSLAPGLHNVSVSRSGYLVNDSAGLSKTPVAIDETTEKALGFVREEIPLPSDWVTSSSREAGEIVSDIPEPQLLQ